MRLRPFAPAAALVVILPLTACGGGRRVANATPQTCGKELQDLQEARDRGAMSAREYERVRKATIERCSKQR